MSFKKLVRFQLNSSTSYGDLLEIEGDSYNVERLNGTPFEKLSRTGEILKVQKLLCPLEATPIVQCVGLNYRKHAKEASLPVPKYPPIFTKPADSLAGPDEDIEIHPDAQGMLDWEGELTVIMGRDAKNVSSEEALDYVLGYTAGNDLSARNFQAPEASGGQFRYCKSFDKFAPIGHTIIAASEVPDPQNLHLSTWVNGSLKQDTSTDDMIWSVSEIISHLSRGTTLRKATVIMTGTPSGVGFFEKQFLKQGDEVEVEIEGLVTLKNTIRH